MARDMQVDDVTGALKARAVHARLDEIEVPGSSRDATTYDRLYPVLDRLQLRAEGEPDCADLADQVAAINAACDDAGIAKLEGQSAKRVAVMAEMLAEDRAVSKHQTSKVQELLAELAVVRADLEAERAQLAASPRSQPPFAAFIDDMRHYVERCGCESVSAVCNGYRVTIEPVTP